MEIYLFVGFLLTNINLVFDSFSESILLFLPPFLTGKTKLGQQQNTHT